MEPITSDDQEQTFWHELQLLKSISKGIEQLQLDLIEGFREKIIPNPDKYVDVDPTLNDLLVDVLFVSDRLDEILDEWNEEKAYT